MVEIITATFIVASLQAIGHYFRWELWTGRPISKMAAYTWGVAAILIAQVIWLALTNGRHDAAEATAITFILSAVSGAVALGTRALDHLGEQMHYARSRKTMDAAAEEAR